MALCHDQVAVEKTIGDPAGLEQQRLVGDRIGEAQQRCTRLACTEQLAGAANLEVAPRDLEAVAGFQQGLQARLGGVGERRLV